MQEKQLHPESTKPLNNAVKTKDRPKTKRSSPDLTGNPNRATSQLLVKRRGKEREAPKVKKMTKLKRTILQDRENAKKENGTENEEEKQLLQSFITQTQLHNNISQPYISGASAHLIKHFVKDFHHGITVTCPGFYGPQGRVIRLGLRNPDLLNRLTQFVFGRHRVTNFEMETAGIYGLGKILGHHCLSLSAIVANRVMKTFSKDGHHAVKKLVEKTLETVCSF